MKKITLLAITLLFTIVSFSQEKITTTDEEYNYLIKGYAENLKNGLDLKKGYSFELMKEATKDGFVISLKEFKNEAKQTKAILVELRKIKEGDDKVFYRCLPINRPDLAFKVWNSFKSGSLYNSSTIGSSMAAAFEESIFNLLVNEISDLKNK